jgi:hypothetical protein
VLLAALSSIPIRSLAMTQLRQRMLDDMSVFEELANNLIRFVQGATKPRPAHPKPHRKHAYKSTT